MKLNRISVRKLPVTRDFLIKQFQQKALQDVHKHLQRNKSDAAIKTKIQILLEKEKQFQKQQSKSILVKPQEPVLDQKKIAQPNLDAKPYQLHNQKEFVEHINFIVSKNPEYFEHLSGKCSCFRTNFLKRCSGMDQNNYKRSSRIESTYEKDFVRSKSNIDPRAAQLKSDPYQSSFYDYGTKKYFMDQKTIANVDFSNQYFPKTTLIYNRVRKNQIEQSEADKEPMLYTKSHYDQQFQGLVCPPVIPYHKLIHQNENNYLKNKNPFKFNSKSIYGTSYYNWSDRFIPNPVYDKTKLLGIFSTSMPFQARSTTKTSYSKEYAKVREVEKPIKYESAPQVLPAFKRQFVSTASEDFSRAYNFGQQNNQAAQMPDTQQHIIEQIKDQLANRNEKI